MANRAASEPFPALSVDRYVDPKIRRFQVAGGGDGLTIFVPHPRFWLRNLIRVAHRARGKVYEACAPVPVPAVIAAQGAAMAWLLGSKSTSFARNMTLSNWLWKIDSEYSPLAKYCSTEVRVAYLCFGTGLATVSVFTFVHRRFLRFLLSYTGWMDEGRGKKSLKTKIWGFLLKYIYMRRSATPTLGLQSCLPRQPLPALADTVQRYLLSMEAVLDDAEMKAVKEDAQRFLKQEGLKLQRYLTWKHLTSVNYVSDWWLSVVYLRGRDSIMVNSNYFGVSIYRAPPTTSQAARAAVLTHNLMKIKLTLDKEELPRMMIQDIVPICMQQYAMTFSTTRIPGHEEDKLVQYDSSVSRHIAVRCRGHFYRVQVFDHRTGRLLSPLQLEAAMQGILDASAKDTQPPTESNLGALTALPRSEWATIREDLLKRDKINRVALEAIESSVFFVALDDETVPFADLTRCGQIGLHGDGTNRWFDKSFNMIVTSDGNTMINGEHAWADAPTLGHVYELAVAADFRAAFNGEAYNPDGSVKPSAQEEVALKAGRVAFYRPERILFNMSDELTKQCNRAAVEATKLIDEVHLVSKHFDDFGKGVIKKCKVSPDAFVQMALQLAYYRDQGHVTQTYESGMARLYQEGRTETIRSASNESTRFVKAMCDENATDAERAEYLRIACEKHARTTQLAMTGRGVDRHMFALYVVAVGTQTDSSFLSTAMKRGWKLSTSQIPQMVSDIVKKNDFDDFPRPAGGFGPVAKDGYGVCYTISGENMLFFHVTSNRSSPATDSERMMGRVVQAMNDMRRVALATRPAAKA